LWSVARDSLHACPTRRSSDLVPETPRGGSGYCGGRSLASNPAWSRVAENGDGEKGEEEGRNSRAQATGTSLFDEPHIHAGLGGSRGDVGSPRTRSRSVWHVDPGSSS